MLLAPTATDTEIAVACPSPQSAFANMTDGLRKALPVTVEICSPRASGVTGGVH